MRTGKSMLLVPFAALALSACATNEGGSVDGGDENTGSVVAYLKGVPDGVMCVTLTATTSGGTFNASQTVSDTAEDVELFIGPLPFGSATVSASAFTSACGTAGAVAAWKSDPLSVSITASNVTDLDLVLRPYSSTGVDVSFKPLVTDFAVGGNAMLVALQDHNVEVFGSDYYAGGVNQRTDVARVFAAQWSSCFTTVDGHLWCSGDNTHGALGIGTTSDSVYATPQELIVASVEQVSMMSSNACAVTSSGNIYCWGSNEWNQITVNASGDLRMPFFIGSAMRDVAVGREHMCNLTRYGYVSCRGSNTYGQMGNGATTPDAGASSTNIVNGATQLAAGLRTTYALMGDGTVKAWGSNGSGQAANGTATTPVTTPTTISGLSGVVQVSASVNNACALTSIGEVFCWGEGSSGKVGNGKVANQLTSVKVLSGVKRLSNGGTSAMCALMTNGDLMCWGYNSNGELGDGTMNTLFVPTLVTDW